MQQAFRGQFFLSLLAGLLILAGFAASEIHGQSAGFNQELLPKAGPPRSAWLVKLDHRGEVVWRRDFPEAVGIGSLRPGQGGRIIAAGVRDGHYKTTGKPWTAVLDPEGRMIREYRLEGDGRDAPVGLEAPDGGVILAGEGLNPSRQKAYDIYLKKMAPLGVEEWITWHGWEGVENFRAVIPVTGGYVLAGRTWSSGGPPRAWLFKVNERGEPLWSRFFDDKANQVANSLCTLPDGGLGLAIETMFPEKDQARLIRVDEQGLVRWATPYRDLFNPLLACGGPNRIFLAGSFNPDPPARKTNNTWSAAMERLDLEGRSLWKREYRGLYVKAAAAAADGGLIVAGWSTAYSTTISSVAYIVKIDEAGNPGWFKTIEGPRGDTALALLPTPDGGCLVGGKSGDGGR